MKRNKNNRTLTFYVYIYTQDDLSILNEFFRWINAQKHNIKLQFNIYIEGRDVKHENFIEFLNSNHIVEIET